MKVLKISIAVIVISTIAFFIIWSVEIIVDPIFSLPENQFNKRIEQKIDSLSKLPNNKFCNDFYQEICYYIGSYHKDKRLGYNPVTNKYDSLTNEQRKSIYTSNLYSAYAEKFISQAFYVFERSEWRYEDLKIIRTEYQTLKKSSLLKEDSPVDKKLTEINNILKKYQEIWDFILACEGFTFLRTGLSNDRFPISDVKTKISQKTSYKNTRLGNEYVNNCSRLHNNLDSIPIFLFRAHVRYLDNKIRYHSNKFRRPRYNSYSEYIDIMNDPLSIEIGSLNNDIYSINRDNFNDRRNRLVRRLNDDKNSARGYWSKLK